MLSRMEKFKHYTKSLNRAVMPSEKQAKTGDIKDHISYPKFNGKK